MNTTLAKKLSKCWLMYTYTVLSIEAHKDWKVLHLEVKSAFLNEYLNEEVFVVQSQGFENKGKEHHVYKLKKALYRFKKAPRAYTHG